MRREDGVRQDPAPHIGLVARTAPGGNGGIGQRAAAARDGGGGGGGDHTPACDAKKGTAVHGGLRWVAMDALWESIAPSTIDEPQTSVMQK